MASKKPLIQAIKELNANARALREFSVSKYVDERGIAVVHVYLTDEGMYDPFSNPEEPEISQAFFDYIDREVYSIPVEYPVEIMIHAKDGNDDVEYIQKKVKEHYWKKLSDKHLDLRNNKFIAILLASIGAVMFALYFAFEFSKDINLVFNEIFSIVATFLIWESVDYGFIIRQTLRIEYYNASQMALAKVSKRIE